jgi:hypothetical protein
MTEPMATAAHDHRQCMRCEEWKHISRFPDYGGWLLPESRRVCVDCFPNWLDEQWALDQVKPRQV